MQENIDSTLSITDNLNIKGLKYPGTMLKHAQLIYRNLSAFLLGDLGFGAYKQLDLAQPFKKTATFVGENLSKHYN